jgi:hypothetical protein
MGQHTQQHQTRHRVLRALFARWHAAPVSIVVALSVTTLAMPATGMGPYSRPSATVASHNIKMTTDPPGAFRCLRVFEVAGLKVGHRTSVSVALGEYRVTFTSVGTGLELLRYPGSLVVSSTTDRWTLPRPARVEGFVDTPVGLGVICLLSFHPGQVPYVMAEAYTGAASCCFVPVVYAYLPVAGNFADTDDLGRTTTGHPVRWDPAVGLVPEVIDGTLVLRSDDGYIAGRFGCSACTPGPTRLFTLVDDRLEDVTLRYPSIIRKEASVALSIAVAGMEGQSQEVPFVEGRLTQWAADSCELGKGASMWRTLEQLQQEGDLTLAETSGGGVREFIPMLQALLLQNGYCKGQIPGKS